ncbi:MAG: glycosyltransferase, partial [Rhodospirillaceae bacterium]
MKVVEIDEFYSERGGGVRMYTNQKLAACAELGHNTVIIAPGAEDREDVVPGGKIVWVKAPRIPLDPRYHMFVGRRAIDAIIEQESPDVLVGASPWRGGWI